jgi:hypothetical protein
MIALAAKQRFDGFRYRLFGAISRSADFSQTLDLPADGNTVDITGQTVVLTFRREFYRGPDLTLTLTVSDADTLTISGAPSDFASLACDTYIADITGTLASVVTHWAHGSIAVTDDPA